MHSGRCLVAEKHVNRLSICYLGPNCVQIEFLFQLWSPITYHCHTWRDINIAHVFHCRHLCAFDIRVSKNRVTNWDLIKKGGHEFMGIKSSTNCGFYDELFDIVIIWQASTTWWGCIVGRCSKMLWHITIHSTVHASVYVTSPRSS